MDSFYKVLSDEEKKRANSNDYDFDHPSSFKCGSFLCLSGCITVDTDAFDFDSLLDALVKLKKGKNVNVPIYDFKTHSR
jgi:uridine kinase